jgi:hypothetical protein
LGLLVVEASLEEEEFFPSSHGEAEGEGSKGWVAPFIPSVMSVRGSMHGKGFFFKDHLLRMEAFHLKQDFLT